MTKIVLSLPEPLVEWAQERASSSSFDSVGDYIENLLREERERLDAIEEFDRLVQEGEDSGVSKRTVEEILGEARQLAKDIRYGEV